jgi:hypothetical protein
MCCRSYMYPDPDVPTKTMDTLLIVSVKVTSIDECCLGWPIQVYGVIAARDVLDRKHNIIFHCPRSKDISNGPTYFGPKSCLIWVESRIQMEHYPLPPPLWLFASVLGSGSALSDAYCPSKRCTTTIFFGHIDHMALSHSHCLAHRSKQFIYIIFCG